MFTKHYDSYQKNIHKKIPKIMCFLINTVINSSNYKTCLYNFVSLHKKIPKILNVFTKHYDSYPKKILMCSHKTLFHKHPVFCHKSSVTYKTCLYNFVSLHKKIPKIPMCLQNTTIHIQNRPDVFSQTLFHKQIHKSE